MVTTYAKSGTPLFLGRQGENNARQICFSIAEWRRTYGDGVVQLLAQRHGEDVPYPVALTVDGADVMWTVTAADTAVAGNGGRAELQYFVGDTLVKSSTWSTRVADALGEPSEAPPEPQQGWVDRVLLAGGDAQAAAEAAEAAAKRAEAVDAAGLDTTLTEEGKAADAKAVGEALKNAGAVKTVNGVEPDESGNVEVEVGGDPVQPDWSVNDETANDYIKNRTHYDSRKIETIEITWDGDTTGKTVVSLPMGFDACKVSDIVPTIDELVGGVCQTKKVSTGEGIAAITLDANQCGQIEDGCFYAADILVVTKAGIYFGTEFTEAGIYSPKDLSRDVFVSDLRYTANTGELKQIDMKYLPDPLQFGYKKTVWKDLGEVTVTSQPTTNDDGSITNIMPLVPADGTPPELMVNCQNTFTAGCTIPLVRVVFDGVEYELPVLDAAVVPEFIQGQGVAYVCGNLSLLKGILYDPALDIADTGEPFGLALTLGFMGTSETEPATHTVAVSAGTVEPVKVAAEYLPFYHAVDKVELVNGTITTENQIADPDTPFYLSAWEQAVTLDRIPEKLTVVFDGVEYAELKGTIRHSAMIGTTVGFGNKAVEDPGAVGGELDTGEPFLVRLIPLLAGTMNLSLLTNTPTGQTHSLVVSTVATHDLDMGGNARFGGTVEARSFIVAGSGGARFEIYVNENGKLSAVELP